MEEIWKEKELNGLNYYISNFGNIKTKNKYIKLRNDKDGYLVFTAGTKNNRNSFKVHRLVAELYVENPNNKPEVNHLDFNRNNSKFDNLSWCTHLENIEYSVKNNKNIIINNNGENNPNSKLTEENVRAIKNMIDNNKKVSEIARKFNVGWQTINHIKNGNTWTNV